MPGINEDGMTEAFAINDSGVVVGWGTTLNGDYHAFRWIAGFMIDMGLLAGTTESIATDINNAGQFVGTASGNHGKAFFSAGRGLRALPMLSTDTDSNAEAINDSGQIVGVCANTSGAVRAMLWPNR